LREKKYDYLSKKDIKTTKRKKLSPKSEFYLFIPREEKLLKEYEKYPKITDIFPVNSVGIVTARDNFVIDFDKETLKRRIRMFCDEKTPDEIIRQTFGLKDKSNWKLKDARKNVMEDENREDLITQILYRPFDSRWIFYHDMLIERSRKEVMQHMLHENLGLLTHRREELDVPYTHVLVTNLISEHGCLSSKTTNYHFPLYLYQKKEKPKKRSSGSVMMLFEPQAEYGVKKPNISPAIVEQLTKDFKKTPSPEQIFYYIYAILYSNTYRTKYTEFLKMDFPRIPFTADYKIFSKMAEYGKRLVDLHLLKSAEQPPESPLTKGELEGIVKFQGKGDFKVEKLRYDENHLYINQNQYFEGVSKEVYRYQIGGYQVCDKWLKDRKGRSLSLDDIKHYCNIVTSIQKTIEIQKAIDDVFIKIE
jgi:predicted helicase